MWSAAWFTAGENAGDDMAEIACARLVDLSIFGTYAIGTVNEPISGTAGSDGGFNNFLLRPE
jgi:hypothetical protein